MVFLHSGIQGLRLLPAVAPLPLEFQNSEDGEKEHGKSSLNPFGLQVTPITSSPNLLMTSHWVTRSARGARNIISGSAASSQQHLYTMTGRTHFWWTPCPLCFVNHRRKSWESLGSGFRCHVTCRTGKNTQCCLISRTTSPAPSIFYAGMCDGPDGEHEYHLLFVLGTTLSLICSHSPGGYSVCSSPYISPRPPTTLPPLVGSSASSTSPWSDQLSLGKWLALLTYGL